MLVWYCGVVLLVVCVILHVLVCECFIVVLGFVDACDGGIGYLIPCVIVLLGDCDIVSCVCSFGSCICLLCVFVILFVCVCGTLRLFCYICGFVILYFFCPACVCGGDRLLVSVLFLLFCFVCGCACVCPCVRNCLQGRACRLHLCLLIDMCLWM